MRAKLASDENVLAALQVDLSADLRFVSGWVVVTSRRLLACDPGATVWRDWALAPGLALKLQDHGGVGTLELHNPQERVAFWRFTLGHHPQALRLVQRFEQQVERGAGQAATEEEEPACPACHTPLPPDTDECPACAHDKPQAARAAKSSPPRYVNTSQGSMVCPFWYGIRMSSISGMVRYGGTSVAAVDAMVRAKPAASCLR